jgi:hypothetical protein
MIEMQWVVNKTAVSFQYATSVKSRENVDMHAYAPYNGEGLGLIICVPYSLEKVLNAGLGVSVSF